ncbi:MAG TPA: hypothetical protein ENK91_10735 [Bacteroidetes bacterium]|nr:hypothetical protein [Bacteroidota bacterium]
MEKIAKEATNIADAWEYIAKMVIKNKPLDPTEREKLSDKYKSEMMIPSNAGPYSELLSFYSLTSRAIGDKVNGYWLNEIYNQIGEVLTNRKKTYETFSDLVHDIENPFFFNEENYGKKINDLVDYVSILRK